MTKPKTAIEKRRDLNKAVAELDLERAKTLHEIMTRPAMVEALEELRPIYDPETARTPSLASDINGQIRAAITALENIPITAASLVTHLETVVNGPEPIDPALVPVPAMPTPNA